MNDAVWTFEELSRDCDGHYCMADGKDYPALCRYEENMTGHPLGDVCGADCMGECSERFCPSEEVRRLIGKPKPMQRRGFRRAEETDPATGETVTGWRWQRKRRRA